ncbi:MAG: hypothetical protein ABFR90_00150 [Planctomycetota bacterium]
MSMRIAMGLTEDAGRDSTIVALGAAKLIAIYDLAKDVLEILPREDCGDCISAVSSLDTEAIYQPVPKICPTIRKEAEGKGVKLLTGECKSVRMLIENLCELRELE